MRLILISLYLPDNAATCAHRMLAADNFMQDRWRGAFACALSAGSKGMLGSSRLTGGAWTPQVNRASLATTKWRLTTAQRATTTTGGDGLAEALAVAAVGGALRRDATETPPAPARGTTKGRKCRRAVACQALLALPVSFCWRLLQSDRRTKSCAGIVRGRLCARLLHAVSSGCHGAGVHACDQEGVAVGHARVGACGQALTASWELRGAKMLVVPSLCQARLSCPAMRPDAFSVQFRQRICTCV